MQMTVFFLSYFTRILYYTIAYVYTRETHYRRALQQMQFVPTYAEAHDKTNIFLVHGRNHIRPKNRTLMIRLVSLLSRFLMTSKFSRRR